MQQFINVVTLGDSYDVLKELPELSIDSVVTDPPYGLSKEPDIREVLTHWMNDQEYRHPGKGFMGKEWDSFVPSPSLWREVYRVLKPGGHILCFAGTRTQDLMTTALRLAGFEIRDVIEWLYVKGFPKSMNVSKQFDRQAGAEREVIGTQKAGIGSGKTYAFQDENSQAVKEVPIKLPTTDLAKQWDGWGTALKPAHEPILLARKPLEKTVCNNVETYGTGGLNIDGCKIGEMGRFPANCVTIDPDQWYAPYFNVTSRELSKKASKNDRNTDWQGNVISLEEKCGGSMCGSADGSLTGGKIPKYRNNHPTVKPRDLMAWLCRLITPPGGIVLDPFGGSGSTAVAAKREGFNFIVIEKDPDYFEIAKSRVA
ncbi:site-specific DNA-methyltransferase (adenine-specific) [Desulfotomaculum arcticum]|uniref:Methyltransferase n=1 Tax=Desulfotruncus arcticus DSM 17038 TaxID=1121424 RepID=A0A1I2YAD7_9FIRM|nr:site-specific DNA-methyltransferase [Desulfotruncus arcticus]SFH22329.1 site-specific DNA-methyltransferase (adenine-specific) [Desulfotomaculum arcticum] [Desulfotruncus arcticus DSM 17038]